MDSAQSTPSTPTTGSTPLGDSLVTPPDVSSTQTPTTPDPTPVPPTTPSENSNPTATPSQGAAAGVSTQESGVSGMPTSPVVPPPLPPTPPHAHSSSGINKWMISTIVLFLILLVIGIFVVAKIQLSNQTVSQMPTPIPQESGITTTPSTSVTPVASPTASITTTQTGTVSGTLCYPSSMIPAGTLTAKSTTTSKEFTKSYAGSQAGAGTTYSMDLTPDSYHLKFTPTQYSTVIGYYTDYSSCVGNPSGADCSGEKTRPLLSATVTADATVKDVNLCDYYYPQASPPQF